MKYLFFVLFFGSALCASASTTAITASNITDVTGNRIASARLCFAAVDEDGDPIGYRSGTAQVVPAKKCGIVSNGVLQSGFTVLDSSTTVPTNVRYHITLSPTGNIAITQRDFGITTITGSSWTLDTFDASTTALPSIYTASSTSGDLAVNGNLSISGTLTLGNTVVNGTLSTTGAATLASATVSGVFGVTGTSTLSNTAISGTLGVTGAATLAGMLTTGPITESGSTGNTFTITGTGSTYNALAVIQSSLATGFYYTGFQAGTAVNSSFNSAIFQFANAGGAGSTGNYASMAVYGGAPLAVFGTGDVAVATATDCGYRLCVNGSADIGGTVFLKGNGMYDTFLVQGAYIDWNYGNGSGETDFINNRGSGPGGFDWYNATTLGAVVSSIMTLSGSGALTVPGAVTGASWTATSDKREKHNIKTLDPELALKEVNKIRAVQFDWNSGDDHQRQTGWIAQEVEAGGLRSSVNVKPGTVHHADGTMVDVADFRTLKQNEMTAVLWSAVQELNRKVDGLGPAPKQHRIGRKFPWLGL
ncbi:tail fiber domain-containing protein [Telmatobacter bradus]|uniref:tail fiber domain-containing protein n=1 Tax=Telmatobacter bradus TaxID=474953 RepID=UPI003B42F9B6